MVRLLRLPPRRRIPISSIRIKPPWEWTLMGTEQRNLDVPLKVTGKTIYGIDVRLPGMKWAAVKACPVYGGTV
jgi:isoquinoline 1-oxidoreductase beta subunit